MPKVAKKFVIAKPPAEAKKPYECAARQMRADGTRVNQVDKYSVARADKYGWAISIARAVRARVQR